jgi:aldose 1-epimerase
MNISTKRVASPKGEVTLYTITNASGASVTLSTVGAGIVSIVVPDAKGNLADVVLGYDNAADYFYDGPCAGKVPGRYANRIARGHFSLDGVDYTLAINNGPNALHGGPEGYQNQIWEAEAHDNQVVFSHVSPDGDEGYPGNLKVQAIYTWSESNELSLQLKAVTDRKTIINLTNHAYFNLSGHNSGSALDHTLWLACSKYLPTDDTLIPEGVIAPVAGTPMDFTTPHAIGRDIKADFPALVYGKGYDNCWVVDDYTPGKVQLVARLEDDKSGRVLEVLTNQPAAQVYTANWMEGCPVAKQGHVYHDYDGVAIECQDMPDAPNHDNFPSTVLNPGETFNRTIIFSFKNK